MQTEMNNADTFEPLLNAAFCIHFGDQHVVEASLIEVKRLSRATNRDDIPIRTDPYSLIFKLGEPEESFNQGFVQIENSELGTVEMFLVRVGFGEYQAIFN